MGMATVDDISFAEASSSLLASDDDSVATDNAFVCEDTCHQLDANVSLLDRAQVLWSQSVSAFRSQVFKRNSSQEDSRANACDSESSNSESSFSDAGQASECFNGGRTEHGTPHEATAANATTVVMECMEAAVPAVIHGAQTEMAEASDSSATGADCGAPTDNSSVAKATCQQADGSASLVDCAQVFWSQSLSAVRSTVPQPIKDPTATSADTTVDADAAPSREAGAEAATSADVMIDDMPGAGTSASRRTLQSDGELEAAAGFDEELPADGSAEAPVVSTNSSPVTHSVPVSASHSEQTYVDATRLDQAQVFASLAASVLRSQVSALTSLRSVVVA